MFCRTRLLWLSTNLRQRWLFMMSSYCRCIYTVFHKNAPVCTCCLCVCMEHSYILLRYFLLFPSPMWPIMCLIDWERLIDWVRLNKPYSINESFFYFRTLFSGITARNSTELCHMFGHERVKIGVFWNSVSATFSRRRGRPHQSFLLG